MAEPERACPCWFLGNFPAEVTWRGKVKDWFWETASPSIIPTPLCTRKGLWEVLDLGRGVGLKADGAPVWTEEVASGEGRSGEELMGLRRGGGLGGYFTTVSHASGESSLP